MPMSFLTANFAFSFINSSSNTSTAVLFSLLWFLGSEVGINENGSGREDRWFWRRIES
jgi:hypothetical protein